MRFLTVFLMVVILGISSAPRGYAEEGFAENVMLIQPGMTAPLEPIIYADGQQGSLADFRGEVLVVTLWQTHCPFCRREMPVLNALSKEMAGEGVRVIALGLDQSMPQIEAYMVRHGHDHLQPIMDLDKFNGLLLSVEHFGRMSIATPTTFIVGKDGEVAARVWGLVDWTGEPAKAYLRSLAAAG